MTPVRIEDERQLDPDLRPAAEEPHPQAGALGDRRGVARVRVQVGARDRLGADDVPDPLQPPPQGRRSRGRTRAAA